MRVYVSSDTEETYSLRVCSAGIYRGNADVNMIAIKWSMSGICPLSATVLSFLFLLLCF